MPGHLPVGGKHITDKKHPTAVIRKSIELNTTSEHHPQYKMSADTELDELCSFLTLHKNSSPMNFSEWIELEDWVPSHGQHMSGMEEKGTELHYRREVSINQNEWDLLSPIYEQYAKLAQNNRTAIQSSLNRIKNSKVRWNITDRVIDLVVALESILLDSSEDYGLKRKFSERDSLILDNTDKTKEFFRTLYKCRCDAVHNGKIKDSYSITNHKEIDSNELIEQATKHAIEIFSSIIIKGFIPKWIS